MDRNTIIGLVLIAATLIGYSIFTSPSKEELEKRKHIQDSVYKAQLVADSMNALLIKKQSDTLKQDSSKKVGDAVVTDTNTATGNVLKWGIFAKAAQGKDKYYTLETDLLKIKFAAKGGAINSVQLKQFVTYDSLPLEMFIPDSNIFSLNFFAFNRSISSQELYFVPVYKNKIYDSEQSLKVTANDSLQFIMRLVADTVNPVNPAKYIDFIYTVRGNDYMVDYKIKFHQLQDVLASNSNYVNIDWNQAMPKQEKSVDNERTASTIYYKYFDDDVDFITETRDDVEDLKTKVHWLGFKQQFFTTVLIAPKGFSNAKIKTFTNKPNKKYNKSASAQITAQIEPGAEQVLPMQFYFGPNKYKILRKYKIDLERQIPLGWSFFLMHWINRYAVIPVFNFLEGFNLNYGIIILILTLLLKIVLFPIAYKTYLSSARMRVLKPEVDEIGKKFPDKADALKKQQAVMAMYKKAGVSPMSGCIPVLLQFPILIAFFRFFPAAIELRQQSFLWAEDLSTFDSIAQLPFNIPFYGDHVSLFTLLMTISTLIYTMLNNQMMSTGQQMPGMKFMMYMMPVMFLGFFNNFSAGLSYYYLLANLITFAQMFVFRKAINEEKILMKIEEYKKRPQSDKKSKFQQRLEEMAKQRGYKMPKKK